MGQWVHAVAVCALFFVFWVYVFFDLAMIQLFPSLKVLHFTLQHTHVGIDLTPYTSMSACSFDHAWLGFKCAVVNVSILTMNDMPVQWQMGYLTFSADSLGSMEPFIWFKIIVWGFLPPTEPFARLGIPNIADFICPLNWQQFVIWTC